MNKIFLVLPKEKFKALKGQDVEKIIQGNLPKVERTLKADREAYLREKLRKLEEKLTEIESHLDELREFYERAKGDKEKLFTVRDELRDENERLRKELKKRKFTNRERTVNGA